MSNNILGISCFYHDSAAALVVDGEIIAAAQEERFTRIKHDAGFPINAIMYCLEDGRISSSGIDLIVFYDKPLLTFDRLLSSYLSVAPRGLNSWLSAMPRWLSEKLFIPSIIKKGIDTECKILFTKHHLAHAASAYYPSPYNDAAILTVDGVGEWATAAIGIGEGNNVKLIKELWFPDSLGLLYSAFTYFCGFKVNSGEYKLMGLAPYGEPKYVDLILSKIVDLKDDGSIRLNIKYFSFLHDLKMINNLFSDLFGGPARVPETPITRREMDIASSIQKVTEMIMLKMANHAFAVTGKKNLCLAGGVALNCVANGIILREGPFENIWIQPAAGDAGGALGAALLGYHGYFDKPRVLPEGKNHDKQKGSYLGPSFGKEEIKAFLNTYGYPYHELRHEERSYTVAKYVANGKVVGYFSGRMEFGPRALGARSIIGDSRNPDMQRIMNLKIKYRESFRPFAPAVLLERSHEYFSFDGESPYMLMVAPIREARRLERELSDKEDNFLYKINERRSDIPAVTHWDYSARLQTVNMKSSPDFHNVIKAFESITGCAVLINTSFNVRGEPIVCTPQDAYRCFMRTGMDALYLDGLWLLKEEQPKWEEARNWKNDLILD